LVNIVPKDPSRKSKSELLSIPGCDISRKCSSPICEDLLLEIQFGVVAIGRFSFVY
jgi:hypothetical protein